MNDVKWNLKGRSATASLDPTVRHRIQSSMGMSACANKPLLWVLEELTCITHIGCIPSFQHADSHSKVEYFLALVFRILQICPSPSIVQAMLAQDLHKYVRVAALMIIRLIGSDSFIRLALSTSWKDYRKIVVYDVEESWKREGKEAGTATAVNPLKRSRSDILGSDVQEAPVGHAKFFIRRLDEVVDALFGIQLHDAGYTICEETTFCGIPLPSLLWFYSQLPEQPYP